ncbi:MAG: response regulator [Phyllobacteriaceae bacterium]|nr:response regulator [Phyllobacteriaceae bacterium]
MTATATVIRAEYPASGLSRKADGGQRRVLYAEDQVSSRVVTKAMLERMGFEVEAVDDGEVAVEKAREGLYDIILLDIEMPVMDGVTAARIIRSEILAHKDTPILALSAFLADSTEHCVWRDAFDTAVPKPANSNELQRAITRAMACHKSSDTAPEVAEIAAPVEHLWADMRKSLSRGTLLLIVSSATAEMHHLALAMAAAREAGDTEQWRKCRHALQGLARNFGLGELDLMITGTREAPGALNISAIFALVEDWRKQSTVH